MIECDIASYADNNTPYNFDFNLDNAKSSLEKPANSLLNWFRENHVKANADKCNLLVLMKTVQLRLKILILKIAPKKNC